MERNPFTVMYLKGPPENKFYRPWINLRPPLYQFKDLWYGTTLRYRYHVMLASHSSSPAPSSASAKLLFAVLCNASGVARRQGQGRLAKEEAALPLLRCGFLKKLLCVGARHVSDFFSRPLPPRSRSRCR